ncbi:MAG: hypothetical protein QXP80_05695 [Zestosphaera sp.]
MPSGVDKFVVLYAGLTTSFNIALLLLRESRVDAYIALNILSFYVSYSLTRPFPRADVLVKLTHVALLTLFTLIVSMRVYEVLTR